MDSPEVSIVNRDPKNNNEFLSVNFEDVFAEPEDTHSPGCVWRNGFGCYRGGKNCCYKVLTSICGLCISLAWGCEFAVISFSMVWCILPSLRVYAICCGCLQKAFGTAMTCLLAPICENCGLFFSNMHLQKHGS